MRVLIALLLSSALHAQAPKLYLYLVSHNEDNIGYLNGPTGFTRYTTARGKLIEVCDMVQAKKMKYNWGSDHVALRAIAQFDTGSTLLSTNGKNLAKWMTEDRGIECDPHSHEMTYNYADVAYLMSQLGIAPSNTMSGYLYGQLQNGHSWEDYQDGEPGDSFPGYTWYPEIKWGAGSPGHVADLNYFGVYRPKSMSEFTVHEPTNHLIFCGTGCALKLTDTTNVAEEIAAIRNTIAAIQGGALPAHGIYMQEVFFSEGDVADPWFMPLLDEFTDSLNVIVSEGTAEWKNIAPIVEEWKNTFNNEPFAADCEGNIILQPTGISELGEEGNMRVWPNPVAGATLQLSLPAEYVGEEVRIYDLNSRLLLTEAIKRSGCVDVSWIKPGIYVLKIRDLRLTWVRM